MDKDRQNSIHWAIASLGGGGAFVGVNLFDLVNLATGRAHGMILTAAGITAGAGGTASPPDYTEFRTKRPANFNDFDGAGARFTSGSAAFVYGVSASVLTIKDTYAPPPVRPNDVFFDGDRELLARVTILDSGWGVALSGSAAIHGVLKVTYGSGRPMGDLNVPRYYEIDDPVSRGEVLNRYEHKPGETPILLPSDVLFDFDKSVLRAEANAVLRNAVPIINRRSRPIVSIEGHTDSKGAKDYNLRLSLARANEVKAWMIREKVPNAENFRIKGWGEQKPMAPNTTPDGRDDPEGRQKNRRVEIVFE